MIRKTALLAAAAASIVGFTAAPSSAATQEIAYYGPAGVKVGTSATVHGYGYGNQLPISLGTSTPGVCSVVPQSPGVYSVSLNAPGTCVLDVHVNAGGGYDAADQVRTIRVGLSGGLFF
jgi:hypothetical protein